MEEKKILSVDIESVIKNKSKGKVKVPRLIINWLKRIIHQNDINGFLKDSHGKVGKEFLEASFKFLSVSYKVHGGENLDPNGRYVFVSNHPLGGLDGMIVADYICEHYGNVRILSNDLLTVLDPVLPFFIPINKYGSVSSDTAKRINDEFNSDLQILNFPAGMCSRLIKGEIQDLKWTRTFAKKALDSKRDIVPIFFDSRNSMFFLRLAQLRNFLGIKFNIETIFLVDEMFKKKNVNFEFYIGDIIPHSQLAEGSINSWVEEIRKKCYSLNPKRK